MTTTGTQLEQKDYLKLLNCTALTPKDDDQARAMINQEFGFEFSKIRIVRLVATYKTDSKYLVKDEEYEREPLYCATDWNYARFDVNGWQYEMINGGLHQYYN